MKYFLGEAAHYSGRDILRHTFAHGSAADSDHLRVALAEHYKVNLDQVALTKNGRSALCLALEALVPKGAEVIVNGFTCQAVAEAVRAAGCTPVYADITKATLHYDLKSLQKTYKAHPGAQAIIVQNTLSIPVAEDIFTFARKHNLAIIEDLAHCYGMKYADKTEAGFLGDAAALSFGKGKSIDTITGGALIFRDSSKKAPQPVKNPRFSDSLRARFYPLFARLARALTPTIFAKLWLGFCLKIHWIERSADSALDTNIRLAHWQARLVLRQIEGNLRTGQLRDFALVQNRDELLQKLRQNHFYFDEIWYDCPISPQRYYKKWHFPEQDCPVAVEVAHSIVNIPTYYPKSDLAPAIKLIKDYEYERD